MIERSNLFTLSKTHSGLWNFGQEYCDILGKSLLPGEVVLWVACWTPSTQLSSPHLVIFDFYRQIKNCRLTTNDKYGAWLVYDDLTDVISYLHS